MTIHEWQRSLDSATAEARKSYWLDFYRQAFPDFYKVVDVPTDGRAQRGGIDRNVLMRDGTQYRMQEKVRSDYWGDVLIEVCSDVERQIPGWSRTPADAYDYLAYLVPSFGYGLLFPWPRFRQVLLHFGPDWERLIPHKIAHSRNGSRTWDTDNYPVDTRVLLERIEGSREVRW
jgi:hypothetical protein